MSALTLSGFQSPDVLINVSTHALRDRLLDDARLVRNVTSDFEVELAGQVLVEIRRLTKECEDSRVAIKAPVLDLGRDIDRVAKGFVEGIQTEAVRIGRLVAAYQTEQQRIAADAARARQAELDRIECERMAAEEKARKEAESAMAKAATPEAAEVAAVKAEVAQAEAARAAQRSAESVAVAPAPPPKLAGVSVRQVWKFEVLDINALHAARPELVNLVPDIRQINGFIAAGDRVIPGLRIWQEPETRVRV